MYLLLLEMGESICFSSRWVRAVLSPNANVLIVTDSWIHHTGLKPWTPPEENHKPSTPQPEVPGDDPSYSCKPLEDLRLLFRHEDVWMLPQAEWQPGETLRGTAERTLVTLSENNMEAKFLGNAPCGHYKFKFPQAMRTESNLGAKVFFFKALLLTGDFSEAGKKGQHVWVTKDELSDYLKPKYLAQVRRFLLDL
uniref:Large ribosomal subunit protein mL46 n=1 Tax=Callithrix jacchus TaxID=9483 RepID=A0A8I3X9C1_CALJA